MPLGLARPGEADVSAPDVETLARWIAEGIGFDWDALPADEIERRRIVRTAKYIVPDETKSVMYGAAEYVLKRWPT